MVGTDHQQSIYRNASTNCQMKHECLPYTVQFRPDPSLDRFPFAFFSPTKLSWGSPGGLQLHSGRFLADECDIAGSAFH